ncbi:MAG: hypothetical protein ACI9OJ_000826 [Myxococcota bacterium]|jgi:hypothetical protein
MNARCIVCRTPIAGQPGELCGAPACQVAVLSQPNVVQCEICRVRLTPAERIRGLCQQSTCHLTFSARRREALRQANLKAAQGQVEKAKRDYVAERASRGETIDPEEVLSTVVPANDLDVVRRTDERRDNLREHLWSIIDDARTAVVPPPGAEEESGEVHDRSLEVCGSCLGGCCTMGEDHAYLTPETLARASERLGLDIDTLAECYVQSVPETGYETSCIFHGPRGCGLTRRMRADTCNDHLCGGLTRLRERMAGRSTAAIVVIGMSDNRHVRTETVAGIPK